MHALAPMSRARHRIGIVMFVARERFAPDIGLLGLIRLDGELGDTAAVKHLITAAT